MKIHSGFLKTYEARSSAIRFVRGLSLFPKLTSKTDSTAEEDLRPRFQEDGESPLECWADEMTFLDRTQVSSFSVLLWLMTTALSDLPQLKQLSSTVSDAQSRQSIGTAVVTVASRGLAPQFWTRSSFGHATLTSPRSTG